MGEDLAIPYVILPDWPQRLDLVRGAGYTVLGLTAGPDIVGMASRSN